MTTEAPKVLALAYYDGATEGFLNGLGDDRVYFFKVVAWDQSQDRRLYLLGEVDKSTYMELVEILAKTHQPPTGSTWTPAWIFGNPELEARANSLVEISRRSLDTATFLALGKDLESTVEIVRPSANGLGSAIALAHTSKPGDLADWLAQNL
jgi:hypothetical protein